MGFDLNLDPAYTATNGALIRHESVVLAPGDPAGPMTGMIGSAGHALVMPPYMAGILGTLLLDLIPQIRDRVGQIAVAVRNTLYNISESAGLGSAFANVPISSLALLEYVSGVDLFGSLEEQPLTQEDRNNAPISFRLLKAAGVVTTADIASYAFHGSERLDLNTKAYNGISFQQIRTAEAALPAATLQALDDHIKFLWGGDLGQRSHIEASAAADLAAEVAVVVAAVEAAEPPAAQP
ncbi:unnamed protein product [Polarella glacialis]|uniref:Uncharacterized protein n=1 Tax=Polarella glacialis TaxID=89957 RepID=A0A813EDW2_POLGL|nr:unnamed protein product [Polarella glacialis]